MTLEEAQKVAQVCTSVGDPYHVQELADALTEAFPEFEWTIKDEPGRVLLIVVEERLQSR